MKIFPDKYEVPVVVLANLVYTRTFVTELKGSFYTRHGTISHPVR